MIDLQGFDANEHEPIKEFELLPAGEYLAMISDSELKDTQKGDGKYIKFTFDILDDKFKGRKLWENLNLYNKNEQAVNIAKSHLSSICRAIGVMVPKIASELHGKPMMIKVDVEERGDKPGSFNNKIRSYSPANGVKQSQVTASVKTSPPWKK